MGNSINKGMGGHQSAVMMKDEWLSPPEIIKALGKFDLDPCAPIKRPWATAKKHFTIKDNGLIMPWEGRVWLNPPYGKQLEEWMRKMAQHDNGIALTFARTETRAFFKYVWQKATSVFFIKKRISFYHVNGKMAKYNGGAPSVLIAYNDYNTQMLEACGLEGKFLPVNYTPVIVVGVSPSWFCVVGIAVSRIGMSNLKPVYEMVEKIAPDKVAKNKFWKEKVRQKIYKYRKDKHYGIH